VEYDTFFMAVLRCGAVFAEEKFGDINVIF
jgi:hypothetical protein